MKYFSRHLLMPIMSSEDKDSQSKSHTQVATVDTTNTTTETSVDLSSTHYLVAEEYTVGVPLVRPKANFLEILKAAGATGEIFTKKEICQFLKNYISTRKLYDVQDPRVVYCKNDLLGRVFCVDKFTIDDVINLISKNCNQVPDTCIKRKRHIVARPKEKPSPQHVTSQNASNDEIVTSVTKHGEASRLQRKRKRSTDTKSSESSESKRKTSLSITYSDTENYSYPWYFKLKVETDDESEVLSIQGKETIPVQDSTDDLWFIDNDSVAVDEDAFSLEYELESDETGQLSCSDSSIDFSGKDVLVVCKDSDIEFWADSSCDETDIEFTDGDKWICSECKTSNSPLQRYCVRCWKLRPGWLPENSIKKLPQSRRKIGRSTSAPGNISSSESSGAALESPRKRLSPSKHSHKRSSSKAIRLHYDSDSSVDRSSSAKNCNYSSKIESFDSGIYTSSTQPSSQEAVEKLQKNNSVITKLFDEISEKTEVCEKDCAEQKSPQMNLGVRRTCLNYQVKNDDQETVAVDNIKLDILEKDFRDSRTINTGDFEMSKHSKSRPRNQNSSSSTEGIFCSKSVANVINRTNSPIKEKVTPGKASGSGIQVGGDNCVICMARPKTGSIIHGSTGHQVCCYKCARRLKRQRKSCPVCRRPIHKVVKNFIL